jgi:anti-sigma factor RsiW
MTCREFADFIMDYMTGELPSDERALFERHLQRCPHCPEYLKQYEDSIKAGRRAFESLEDEVPQSVPEELVQAILQATRRPHEGS